MASFAFSAPIASAPAHAEKTESAGEIFFPGNIFFPGDIFDLAEKLRLQNASFLKARGEISEIAGPALEPKSEYRSRLRKVSEAAREASKKGRRSESGKAFEVAQELSSISQQLAGLAGMDILRREPDQIIKYITSVDGTLERLVILKERQSR